MKFIDLGPKWRRLIPDDQLPAILTMSHGQPSNDGHWAALIRFVTPAGTHDVSSISFATEALALQARDEAAAKLTAG